MRRDATGEPGLRVRCPHGFGACDWEVLEPDWTHAPVTDHCCPDGHWFRIEGDDPDNLDEFHFYKIDPEDVKIEHMV